MKLEDWEPKRGMESKEVEVVGIGNTSLSLL